LGGVRVKGPPGLVRGEPQGGQIRLEQDHATRLGVQILKEDLRAPGPLRDARGDRHRPRGEALDEGSLLQVIEGHHPVAHRAIFAHHGVRTELSRPTTLVEWTDAGAGELPTRDSTGEATGSPSATGSAPCAINGSSRRSSSPRPPG